MYENESNIEHRWWKQKPEKIFESVFAKYKQLESTQSYRSAANLRHLRLYGNTESLNVRTLNMIHAEPSTLNNNRVTLNVIQNMIDTVVSKITKSRPKATFLTDGGNFTLQTKAKKLTKYVQGQFDACNYYETASMAFQDACIFGTGAIKFYTEDDSVKAERVLITEIEVDDSESIYGQPRQLHQRKLIHKDMLKEMFPKHAGYIDQASDDRTFQNNYVKKSDMVEVVESWHLRSSSESEDGLHTICLENVTLMSEPYKKDFFPFVFLRWNVRPTGFFGQGLAEQLGGIQLEINKILKTIQVSMHLTSIPKVFVEASSKVVTAHLNNKIGGVIKYVGTKPSYESVSAIPQDLFMHLDRLYNRAFEIAGISQLSARSAKPSGLDSGRALREFSDIESERFQFTARRYQDSFLEAAKIIISMSKDIYQDNKNISVKVKGDEFIETIKWKDVDLEDDQYMMQIFPTSSLSSTPSGKLQDVQELLMAGMISPDQGLKLLDFPDLKSYLDLKNAPIEDIEKTIELIVSEGKYESPEPYQNLDLGISMMQQAYLKYRRSSLPEERLELMRNWIESANELLERAQMEAQQAAMEMQQAQMPPQASMASEPLEQPLPEQPLPEQPLIPEVL